MSPLDMFMINLLSALKHSTSDYCNIETVDGRNNLVFDDGSYATIAHIHGVRNIINREQLETLVLTLSNSLSAFFKTRGHMIQFWFKKDLDASESLNDVSTQKHATAKRVGLDITDLIDEDTNKLLNYVYDEELCVVFWSRPSLLDPLESKLSRDEINDWRKANNYPSASDAQNLLRPISFLRDRHNAFVSKIVSDLSGGEVGCSVSVLDVEKALNAIKRAVNPDVTTRLWKPRLASNRYGYRWKTNGKSKDASELLPAPIPEQLMVSTVSFGEKGSMLSDPTTLRVGQRIYAPLLIERPPNSDTNFNALFNSLNRSETTQNGVVRALPYALSIVIEGDGLGGRGLKNLLINFLGWASNGNRNAKLALTALEEYKRDGGIVVKLSMSAMTWADATPDGVRELGIRKSKLWRQIEAWNGATVSEKSGNPLSAFQTNTIALSPKRITNDCPAPIEDALMLMPFTRPASPFDNGSTLFRSLDGKILKYERFSSDQTTWITLIGGKPGSGKSVLMNNNNLEAALLPGMTELPYLCTLDIGISSRGPVDLLRDSLPENQKHLAVYKRLQNTINDGINPFDTSIGLREPLPKDREFLRNLITLMTTPPERKGLAYEGMSAFVGRLIDATYRYRSDKYESSTPETYKPGHDEFIDQAVGRLNLHIREATTYWELVDAFFNEGMLFEAEVAQRYAVPRLGDLINVARSPNIVDEYGSALTDSGRSLIDTFCTGIREAESDYPVFSSITRFDLGSARVIALDLTDVAPSGSDAAKKQTALMYMMGRQCFMKKIAFSVEDIQLIPMMYRAYYTKMIEKLVDIEKIFCMDEYHKTDNNPSLCAQVLTDGREARKWKLEIILASQLMSDFGEITNIATTKFILDSGNESTRRWLRDNIGLTKTEEYSLIDHVKGPSSIGSTFLAQIDTKKGSFSQLFTMTIGPMRLWALSTTAEDRKLRGLLYAAMPPKIARQILAINFPKGTCKDDIARMKENMSADRDFADEALDESIIEQVARQLIDAHADMIAMAS